MSLETLRQLFIEPPADFGMIPFWFWNDDLADEELLSQIRQFHDAGFSGFIPHARCGLSHRVGYLTPEHFRLLRLVCEEAKCLGMKVVLYDEGSYPSGSARGRVVADAPELAARCLIHMEEKVHGPARGFWRPDSGRALTDELLSVVAHSQDNPQLRRCIPFDSNGIACYDLGNGDWQLTACLSVMSGGTIRGVFPEEEDASAFAPPAADILRPEAVQRFIALTYDRFADELGDLFGNPIMAVFTDEPNPMGREPRRGPNPMPYSDGLFDEIAAVWPHDVVQWLPALWFDFGPETETFRCIYRRTVQQRLEKVYFEPLSIWCADHGLQLTGHPQLSNELRPLRHFHIPGQDIVWRHVVPGWHDNGPDSVAPKVASSAAILVNRKRSATELFGAYGWQLTLDEAKWLIDWHLVRGNNTFFPHACFYSVREQRAYESPPDLGIYNAWWPHWSILNQYTRRTSALLTVATPVYRVGILVDVDDVSWRAAQALTQQHIGFIFLDEQALESVQLAGTKLSIAGQSLEAIICDSYEPIQPTVRNLLKRYQEAGCLIIEKWTADASARLLSHVEPDIQWLGSGSLRVLRNIINNGEVYYLTNEDESSISGDIILPYAGKLEVWDSLTGIMQTWPSEIKQGMTHTQLRLERRQSQFLVVSPALPDSTDKLPYFPGKVVMSIPGPWCAYDSEDRMVPLPCPGDWAQIPGWELFSGTITFRTAFKNTHGRKPAFLDLGDVGDIAQVYLNGHLLGVRAWAPYIFTTGNAICHGQNMLEIHITNSSANRYEGIQRPSGLLSEVVLRDASYDID